MMRPRQHHRTPGPRVNLRRWAALLAAALLLPAGVAAAPDAPTPGAAGQGEFGALGVAVDDGLGYGDGAAAARTPAQIVQLLQASGRFSSAELNRFDLPQQLRVKITAKPSGSEEASAAKLILGAATLFLLPMKQSGDYVFTFEIECRGRSRGVWTHMQTMEQTQFLLADPKSGLQALVSEAVAQFLRQALESGALAAGCR